MRRSSYYGMELYYPDGDLRWSTMKTEISVIMPAYIKLMREAFQRNQGIHSFLPSIVPLACPHKFLSWGSSCILLLQTVEVVSRE
jgi:hypothetical protein